MKNSLHGLNRRLESTQEKKNSEFQGQAIETTQKNTKWTKPLFVHQSDLWDIIKQSNKYVIGVSEKVKR